MVLRALEDLVGFALAFEAALLVVTLAILELNFRIKLLENVME